VTLTRLSAQLLKTGSDGALPITSSFAVTASYTSGTLDISKYSLATSSLGNASGSMSINLNNGNYFSATTTDVTTWAIDNTPGSRAVGFVLSLVSGGAFTQIWPNSVIWPNGVAPTLTAAGQDTLTFITDNGGSAWRGVLSIKDSR